jgi:hypothetical protein
MGNKQETPKMSDGELLNEVVNLLAEEERYVQAITALLTFGVFKYIVFPLPLLSAAIVLENKTQQMVIQKQIFQLKKDITEMCSNFYNVVTVNIFSSVKTEVMESLVYCTVVGCNKTIPGVNNR